MNTVTEISYGLNAVRLSDFHRTTGNRRRRRRRRRHRHHHHIQGFFLG